METYDILEIISNVVADAIVVGGLVDSVKSRLK